MATNMWEALSQNHLTLDQTSTPLEMERFEVELFYYPLALRLLELGRNQKRILAAVAGPPGSGKTAFATLLVAVINAEMQREEAALIQQDGWHYPNVYLDSHMIQHNGEKIPLRRLKGSPNTYDTKSIYAFLERCKAGDQIEYPVYSRQLHDPIPNAGRITANHHILVLEGNYWLLQEDPWQQFQALFDMRILLTTPQKKLLEGLRQRHLRGGKTLEAANRQIASVDLPNIERVAKNSVPAGVIVQKTDSQHISRIDYVTNAPLEER
jgi:pantothenate kinase